MNARIERLENTPYKLPTASEIEDLLSPILTGLDSRIDAGGELISALVSDMETVQEKQKEMIFAIDHGIERVDRAERRVHATIKRARKELSDKGFEDPGLEAEAAELRIVDGGGGPEKSVPEVQPHLGSPAEQPSSVRGVSAAHLARVRSFR